MALCIHFGPGCPADPRQKDTPLGDFGRTSSTVPPTHRRGVHKTPGAIRRLKAAALDYARLFERHELIVSPVLRHTTPKLGHLSPTLPFDVLRDRLTDYVAYTPVQNVTGTPGMSLPLGRTGDGRPVGVQLHGARGDERTLIEVAYLLEQAIPFPRIEQDGEPPASAVAPRE